MDLPEEPFSLAVEGCTTDHQLPEIPAKNSDQLFPDLREYQLVKQWNMGYGFYHRFPECRDQLSFEDLFDHQGHREDQCRPDLLEGLHDDLGRGRFGQERDITTQCEWEKELKCTAVCVG